MYLLKPLRLQNCLFFYLRCTVNLKEKLVYSYIRCYDPKQPMVQGGFKPSNLLSAVKCYTLAKTLAKRPSALVSGTGVPVVIEAEQDSQRQRELPSQEDQSLKLRDLTRGDGSSSRPGHLYAPKTWTTSNGLKNKLTFPYELCIVGSCKSDNNSITTRRLRYSRYCFCNTVSVTNTVGDLLCICNLFVKILVPHVVDGAASSSHQQSAGAEQGEQAQMREAPWVRGQTNAPCTRQVQQPCSYNTQPFHRH